MLWATCVMAGLGSEVIIGGFLRDTMDVETYVASAVHLHFCVHAYL